MNCKLLFFVFTWMFIISSCQHNGIGDNELPDFKGAKDLVLLDSIDLERHGILNPFTISFYDDFLVFRAITGQQELYFLDLRNMTVTEKNIVGPGPNQVNDYELMYNTSKNAITYMDYNKWDIYSFDLDSLRENPATEQKWIYQMPKKKGVAFFTKPLETERYIYLSGVYTSGEKWIYCYDKQSQEYSSYAGFPLYEETKDLESMTKSMIFNNMAKATNGKRLVLCRHGTLDYYDIKDEGGLELYREHHYYLPAITVYPNGTFAYKSKSAKWGFATSIASDDKYIYLLYSDKFVSESQNNEYLFIYDWDGNPVKQYALEKTLYGIAINGTTLYGLSREVEPIVYIYSLEDLIKK